MGKKKLNIFKWLVIVTHTLLFVSCVNNNGWCDYCHYYDTIDVPIESVSTHSQGYLFRLANGKAIYVFHSKRNDLVFRDVDYGLSEITSLSSDTNLLNLVDQYGIEANVIVKIIHYVDSVKCRNVLFSTQPSESESLQSDNSPVAAL